MKQRTVLSFIREQRGQAALWLLLSAGIGFFAPLKSFILQWIIDSKTVEHALMCLLAGVAITVASRDTSRVVYTLCMMSRLFSSFPYHSREKPCQTALLLPALKEKMMSRKMGA